MKLKTKILFTITSVVPIGAALVLTPISSNQAAFAQSRLQQCIRSLITEGVSPDKAAEVCSENRCEGGATNSDRQQRDLIARCMRDLTRIDVDERNSEVVCEEKPIRIRPGGKNIFGTYPEGGGCNTFGCYLPGGGCNTFGCYPPGGSSNVFGTTVIGECNAMSCPAKVPKDLFNVKGKL